MQLETADHHSPDLWLLQHVTAAMLQTIHISRIINKIDITKSRMSPNETLFQYFAIPIRKPFTCTHFPRMFY